MVLISCLKTRVSEPLRIMNIETNNKHKEAGFVLDLYPEKTLIAFGNTRDECYINLLKYIKKDRYIIRKVCGLLREWDGNMHDATWQEEYTFLENDKEFADLYEKKLNKDGDAFAEKPIVKTVPEFSDEVIREWSKRYDTGVGEHDYRYIFVVDCDNKKLMYKVKKIYQSSVEEDMPREYYRTHCFVKAELEDYDINKIWIA